MFLLVFLLLEPPLSTFDDVVAEAVHHQKPLLVFQNCEPIPGPWLGWISKSKNEPLIIVNVVHDGKLVFRAWVTPGVGARQTIENVLRK